MGLKIFFITLVWRLFFITWVWRSFLPHGSEDIFITRVWRSFLSHESEDPSLKSPWVPFNFFSWKIQFVATFAFPFLYFAVTLCRYGYDRVGEDALSEDIFYHQECQRAYAWHASLWSLVSIYLASYFILLIGRKGKNYISLLFIWDTSKDCHVRKFLWDTSDATSLI